MAPSDESGRKTVEDAIAGLLGRFPRPAECATHEVLGAQYDAGLAWVHFARDSGGLGVSAGLQSLVDQRLRAAGVPPSTGDYVGLHQGASAIHGAGSPEQRARYLRPIFTGEEAWCQLFSEPGAGSDLAALATRADRDGDEWVVTGQKVWTSGASTADFAILLARTDPDVPKHRGLTFFVCDMRLPGVEVRPLRQADGDAHFSEVFLSDVRIRDSARVGDVGQGWAISMDCMNSERDGTSELFARPFEWLLELWRRREDRSSPAAVALRDDVMRMYVESRVLELAKLRSREAQGRGGSGVSGSLAKIFASEHTQRFARVVSQLMGADAQVGLDYDAAARGDEAVIAAQRHMVIIRSLAMSIEGGTNEIQRNIVSERVLGLPRDPSADRDIPWRDVPRGFTH
jgi:alkylation response protein AidB-like acyl-CoA dehydrogenase